MGCVPGNSVIRKSAPLRVRRPGGRLKDVGSDSPRIDRHVRCFADAYSAQNGPPILSCGSDGNAELSSVLRLIRCPFIVL